MAGHQLCSEIAAQACSAPPGLEIDASGLLGAAWARNRCLRSALGRLCARNRCLRPALGRLCARNRCHRPALGRLCARNRCHQACSVASEHGNQCPRPLGAACALKIDVTKPARCLLSIEICASGLFGAACALEIDNNKPARCLLRKADSRTDDNRGSKMIGAVILYSVSLDSVLLCTVHVYARVHTSIYIYIYTQYIIWVCPKQTQQVSAMI